MQKLFKNAGFTLIELMVAVMIVGILASIAYPAYQEHVFKTRRAAGKACLLELGQYMERYYTTHMSYVSAVLPDPSAGNGCNRNDDVGRFYTIDFPSIPDASSYQLNATPTGAQTNDKCGTLTLNQIGRRDIISDVTGVSVAVCW
jgi:type IV pilus assembly protein PilE